MNEGLQQALATLIAKLTDSITAVGAVADQIPTLVTQLIGFQIMKYWIWIGVEAVVIVLFPILIFWSVGVLNRLEHKGVLTKEQARQREDYRVGNAWFCFIMACIWAGAGISIVMDIIQLVKLYNFPLVWILDYLKELTTN